MKPIFRLMACLMSACLGASALAQLPACEPGAPGTRERVAIKNASFDDAGANGIRDWIGIEHVRRGDYRFELDAEQPYSKPSSARIRRVGDEDFGCLQQTVMIKSCWVGRKAVLSGFLRSEKASDVGGALVLQANDGGGAILSWNHMNDGKIQGTTPWKRYEIEVPIPAGTYYLRFGFMLEGAGTLWADDLNVDVVY